MSPEDNLPVPYSGKWDVVIRNWDRIFSGIAAAFLIAIGMLVTAAATGADRLFYIFSWIIPSMGVAFTLVTVVVGNRIVSDVRERRNEVEREYDAERREEGEPQQRNSGEEAWVQTQGGEDTVQEVVGQQQKAAGQGADQAQEAAQEPSQQAQDGRWEEGQEEEEPNVRRKNLISEKKRQPDLREEAAESSLLDFLKSTAKTVTVDGEDFYVVEGDLILDEDQLEIYAINEERRRTEQVLGLAPGSLETGIANLGPEPMSGALVGILSRGGKLVRWKEGLTLTYCVLRDTFSSQEKYELARGNMQKATEDWQRICGVQFEHWAELDESPGAQNPGVLFTVRAYDAGGQFIATTFFPTDPFNRRRVLLDESSYFAPDLRFDKVGVLRHALGHVLGFRHEHIRADTPAACPDEPLFGTSRLTAYDPKSVMHYFCGGVGSAELALTDADKLGAQKLYGPPLDQFFFVEE